MIVLADLLCGLVAVYFALLLYVDGVSHRRAFLVLAAFVVAVAGLCAALLGRWQLMPVALVVPLLCAGFFLLGGRYASPWPVRAGKAAATLLIVLALLPPLLMPMPNLPEPSGPHPVGVRDFDLVDTARVGVLDGARDAPRRLLVRAWYPAADVAGMARLSYASAMESRSTFASLASALRMPWFFFDHLRGVATHGYPAAPVLAAEDLPVVFFSHGYGSYPAQNTVLMEHLASHGYLVFSVAHPLDAAAVPFADGEVIETGPGFDLFAPADPRITAAETKAYGAGPMGLKFSAWVEAMRLYRALGTRVHRSAAVWLDDRLFVEGALAGGRVPANVADLIARGNFERVAHTGMSFGGSTSAAVCYLSSRCVAAVNLDGGDYHETPVDQAMPVPLLMLHSDMSAFGALFADAPVAGDAAVFAFNDFSYGTLSGDGDAPVTRLWIRDVAHIGLSDYPLMLRQPLRGVVAGDIDGRELAAILNAIIGGFLDTHLRYLDVGFPAAQVAAFGDAVVPHEAEGVRGWWRGLSSEDQADAIQHWRDAVRTAPASEQRSVPSS